ncbi:MAG TPA: S41 family peptidase [Gammaproteobacteria bacterium]|nr:S41 family peptidase [Gammaproteobacteria bacterium]
MFKVFELRRCASSVAIFVLVATGSMLLSGVAQAACQSSHSPDLKKILSFAVPSSGNLPGGWGGNLPGTLFLSTTMHKGHRVLILRRGDKSALKFSSFASCVQSDFSGKTITLKGWLRTNDVSKFAGLWVREDGDAGTLVLNNMHDQKLHGTTGWKEYSVSIPVKPQARHVVFGALLVGTGKVWVSHLQLLVDGKPIWQAPKKGTVLDTDHEFDKGSRIAITALDKIQIANLVTLGKVWGFLKYYDPTVTAGKRQWDYDLFRIMPTILKAKSRKDANAALVQWVKKLGPVPPCTSCVHLETKNLHLRPDLGWIHDSNRLGKQLSALLERIYNNRTGKQFYGPLRNIGKPKFDHELPYKSVNFPDSGFQLLALYRFWNMIEYWYAYRNLIADNWNHVLAEFIPRLALAKSLKAYERQLMQLAAELHDTHANLWGNSIKDRPPVGKCHLPVRIRYVQGQPVVAAYLAGKQANDSSLQIGDVLVKLDGQPVSKLFKLWAPYYGASNKAALRRQIGNFMTRGACGATTVTIRRDDDVKRIKTQRVPIPGGPDYRPVRFHDLPGPTFRLLSPKVAYIKLSSIKSDQVGSYIKRAQGTKGLIIDIRNYPSQFVAFSLGSTLVSKKTPFNRLTREDLRNPGAFYWRAPTTLTPRKPHYAGKVVVLVDSVTQSQAEYTAMAFRAAGAVVVGSQTAGADGDVAWALLPGNVYTAISGLGVFYPDKQPTQRIGIVPDVVVKPTIADIRAGRDAVLEKAIRLIVGPKVPETKIRKMYETPPMKR